jgi:hypothetical protein
MPVRSDSQPNLRPLVARLREEIPTFTITVANSLAIRGRTPKGDYETRVFLKNGEIRTTFLRKGGNPLQDMRLLCRTPVERAEADSKNTSPPSPATGKNSPGFARKSAAKMATNT